MTGTASSMRHDRQLLVDLHDADPRIVCTRYCFRPDHSRGLSSAPKARSETLYDPKKDQIEAAWRRINGGALGTDEANSTGLGLAAQIQRGCATVARTWGSHERELWVFEMSGNTVNCLELEVLHQTGQSSFRLSDLLYCPKHGSNVSCLSHAKHDPSLPGPSEPCDVRFQPTEDVRAAFQRLGEAMIEKAAWSRGIRVFGHRLEPELHVLAEGDLLLRLPARARRPRPYGASSMTKAGTAGWNSTEVDVVLLPLQVAARRVASFMPAPEQATNLESSFTALVGTAWRNGRSDAILSARLRDEVWSDWSIFWIPRATMTSDDPGGKDPDDPDGVDFDGKGVLVVWPTHLAVSNNPDSSDHGRNLASSSSIPQPAIPILNLPTNADILSASAAAFDFLASYRPPPPPSEPPDEDDETDEAIPLDELGADMLPGLGLDGSTPASIQPAGGPTPAPMPIEHVTAGDRSVDAPSQDAPVAGPAVEDAEDGSDMDDLFSAHSDSPVPGPAPVGPDTLAVPTANAAKTTEGPSPGMRDFEDLFGDTGDMHDFRMDTDGGASRTPAVAEARPAARQRFEGYLDDREGEGEGQMVTEDDFDFFDSSPVLAPADAAVDTDVEDGDGPAGVQVGQPPPVEPFSLRALTRVLSPGGPAEGPPKAAQAPLTSSITPGKRIGIMSFGRTESAEIIDPVAISAFDSFQANLSPAQLDLETDAYVPRKKSSVSGSSAGSVSPTDIVRQGAQGQHIASEGESRNVLPSQEGSAARDGVEPAADILGSSLGEADGPMGKQKRKREDDPRPLDKTAAPEAQVHKNIDTVPSPYAPLDLDSFAPSGAGPYPPYLLSPASTPESHLLRPEMMRHLQAAQLARGPRKGDYAAGWAWFHGHAPRSDEEHGSLDSGQNGWEGDLPPTPESEEEEYTDNESEVGDAPEDDGGEMLREDKGEPDEIVWNGKTIIGPQWMLLGMQDSWKDLELSWTEAKAARSVGVHAPSPGLDIAGSRHRTAALDHVRVALDTVSLDKLAEQIVDNPPLREVLRRQLQGTRPLAAKRTGPSNVILPQLDLLEAPQAPPTASQAPLRIHTGYGGNVLQLSIAALQYWRQIGLGPVGGPKNVAVEVYCADRPGMLALAEGFMADWKQVWGSMGLGKMTVGDGAIKTVPLAGTQGTQGSGGGGDDNDELAVTAAAVARERERPLFTVIFVLLSDGSYVSSLSAFLQQSLTLNPTCIVHPLPLSPLRATQYPSLAQQVYNRLPKPIERIWSRAPLVASLPRPSVYLQHPTFTLAPDEPPKVEISLDWPLASYDLLNRWRIMHLGYTWDGNLGVLVGFMLDQNGEEWGVRVWSGLHDDQGSDETGAALAVSWTERIAALWAWAAEWAGIRAIEWRMAVCREGLMLAEELDAWRAVLGTVRKPVSLLMASLHESSDAPLPRPSKTASTVLPSVLADPGSKIIDLSLFGTTSKLPHRPFLALPLAQADQETKVVIPRSGFVSSIDSSGDMARTTVYILSHRAAPGKEAEDPDEVLAREFYRLTCLARTRFGFRDSGAPVHLQGVRAVVEGLYAYGSGVA